MTVQETIWLAILVFNALLAVIYLSPRLTQLRNQARKDDSQHELNESQHELNLYELQERENERLRRQLKELLKEG